MAPVRQGLVAVFPPAQAVAFRRDLAAVCQLGREEACLPDLVAVGRRVQAAGVQLAQVGACRRDPVEAYQLVREVECQQVPEEDFRMVPVTLGGVYLNSKSYDAPGTTTFRTHVRARTGAALHRNIPRRCAPARARSRQTSRRL